MKCSYCDKELEISVKIGKVYCSVECLMFDGNFGEMTEKQKEDFPKQMEQMEKERMSKKDKND